MASKRIPASKLSLLPSPRSQYNDNEVQDSLAGPALNLLPKAEWVNRYGTLLLIPLAETPDIDTSQLDLNDFLSKLACCLCNDQFSKEQMDAGVGGPLVFHREVSYETSEKRERDLDTYSEGGVSFVHGDLKVTVEDYSATVKDAISAVELRRGSLYLFASKRQSSKADAKDQPGGSDPVWHNTALFIQFRKDFPRRTSQHVKPGIPDHEAYDFKGTFSCAYVYDPAYPNESVVPDGTQGPVTRSSVDFKYSRIRQHLFSSRSSEFLFGKEGVASPLARSREVDWPGNDGTTWIGGGGNQGFSNCRQMSCVWMQQVARRSQDLNRAVFEFKREQTKATLRNFLEAKSTWSSFFQEFTKLRP